MLRSLKSIFKRLWKHGLFSEARKTIRLIEAPPVFQEAVFSRKEGESIVTMVVKVLGIRNATLRVISAGRRLPLAKFCGKIEIIEKQSNVPVLGRLCKGEKKIYASFILCEEVDYHTDDAFHSGKVYEAIGEVEGENTCERLVFSGLRFKDNDPVSGAITFDIADLDLIKKLLVL